MTEIERDTDPDVKFPKRIYRFALPHGRCSYQDVPPSDGQGAWPSREYARADLVAPKPRHEPTEAQIRSACLSYDPNFALMDGPEQLALMHQAREWLRALGNAK